ncbi:MAG: hypothetical protein IPJ71_15290 [Bdellovibrionales bacterium]|nr:hypothetical protein [Bdellovibrionales bacterium]
MKHQKDRASLKFEALLVEGSKDKRSQYTQEYEATVERIDAEMTLMLK